MNRIVKSYIGIALVVLVLVGNALAIWFELLPTWWRQGYYTLPPWAGAGLSLGMAILIIIYAIWQRDNIIK